MCDNFSAALFAAALEPCAKGKSSEIAKTLINKYGSLANVLSKGIEELEGQVGASVATHIKLLAYVTSRRGTEKLKLGRCYTDDELADYFKSVYLGIHVEMIYVMIFDEAGRSVAVANVGEGTVSGSEILTRKMLEVAMAHEARSVLIVHNHPSGDCYPSRGDVKFAAAITTLLESVGIKVRGHMIIAGQRANLMDYNLI